MPPLKAAFVDGEWTTSSASSTLINPATEEPFAEVGIASTNHVDRAVISATRAFDEGPWPRMSADERWDVLHRAQGLLQDAGDELARMQTAQMGAPLSRSHRIVDAALELFDDYRAAMLELPVSVLRRDPGGRQAVVQRNPVGVVAAIAPWNGPLTQACGKILPALIAGCTVVAKPAEETPLELIRLAELFVEAGLPAGAFNVVLGGRRTGAQLVSHPSVAKVSFTGSTAAGKLVAEACASALKRVSLELGGKSAAIVLDDADVSEAAPIIANANFTNAGQVCVSLSRVLVPRSRQEEIVDALTEEARRHILGDPMDPATTMGPLVAARQRDVVEAYIARGRSAGARLVCGGRRPSNLDRGYYIEPTIFADVDNDMVIAREEIFGPVISVIPYDTEVEALAIANDSSFGLYGAVFTSDPVRGLGVAQLVQSGVVGVNSIGFTRTAPFGGVKQSGLGRERGVEGLASYFEYKSIPVPDGLAEQLEASGTPRG